MDPDANLQEQIELATKIVNPVDPPGGNGFDDLEQDAARLAELVLALDEWLVHRGFKPERWEECGNEIHPGNHAGE